MVSQVLNLHLLSFPSCMYIIVLEYACYNIYTLVFLYSYMHTHTNDNQLRKKINDCFAW